MRIGTIVRQNARKNDGGIMTTGNDMGAYVIVFSLLAFAVVATVVALARWIFRINDIVRALNNIVELLRK